MRLAIFCSSLSIFIVLHHTPKNFQKMFDELEKYKKTDHFFFDKSDTLESVCNAPKKGVGVYVVYQLKGGRIELVYIGSSGMVLQSGDLKVRIGGMADDIVNGEQFGKARKVSWKAKLTAENIDAVDVYWYETFDKENHDIPNVVKGVLLQRFYEIHGALPKWNKEF